ncbi:MAG: hypothetical protein RIS92_3234 [Verrucomicrobiota bacterium]
MPVGEPTEQAVGAAVEGDALRCASVGGNGVHVVAAFIVGGERDGVAVGRESWVAFFPFCGGEVRCETTVFWNGPEIAGVDEGEMGVGEGGLPKHGFPRLWRIGAKDRGDKDRGNDHCDEKVKSGAKHVIWGEAVIERGLGESVDEAFKDVAGDGLDAVIRALRRGVDAWPHVTWGGAETVSPPAGGGVKDHIALGSVVNRSRVLTSVEGSGRALGGAGGDDFESGDGCGISVPFPADDAGDAVAEIHAGVFVNPVVGK